MRLKELKRRYPVLLFTFVLACLVVSPGDAAEEKVPVIEGKKIVAMVNHEPITSEEFGKYLANIQHAETGGEKKAGGLNYSEILNRLIDEKLFLQEARNIGIDELPEVKTSIDENARKTLAKLLVRKNLKDIKVDSEAVDKRLREVTAEYKISAVVFEAEEEARKMEKALSSGTAFDDALKNAVAGGKTLESVEGEYLKKSDLMPGVSDVISTMKTGDVSPVIKFKKGYAVVRLEDIRNPEDPEMRERIRSALLRDQREMALYDYKQLLIKKYVTIDEKLLDSIDFDASQEDFNKLLKDRRVLARVRGDGPVTVQDLAKEFQAEYFHGIQEPVSRKQLNSKKAETLDNALEKKVLVLEAKKEGFDKTQEYKDRIDRFKRTILFEQFMNKVIVSDIRLTEDELRKYYSEHADSFTSPEMIRIDSLVFNDRGKAEDAVKTLRSGTEFKWLKENSEGLVSSDAKGVLNFSGRVLSVNVLPGDVQNVLSGVSSGDFRLYESPTGYSYVLYAEQVYPSSISPYEEVKDEILKILYNQKVRESVKEWAGKLKAHYPVEIYIKEF